MFENWLTLMLVGIPTIGLGFICTYIALTALYRDFIGNRQSQLLRLRLEVQGERVIVAVTSPAQRIKLSTLVLCLLEDATSQKESEHSRWLASGGFTTDYRPDVTYSKTLQRVELMSPGTTIVVEPDQPHNFEVPLMHAAGEEAQWLELSATLANPEPYFKDLRAYHFVREGSRDLKLPATAIEASKVSRQGERGGP